MKAKICILIFAVAFVFSSRLAAQFTPDYSGNFYAQIAHWNKYYDSVRNARLACGNLNMQGTGYSKYAMWVNNWRPYIPPGGEMTEAIKVFREVHNQKRYEHLLDIQTHGAASLAVNVPPINWNEIGPKSYNNILTLDTNPNNSNQVEWFNPHSTNTGNSIFGAHVGRFDRIFRHPSQSNTFFAYAGDPDNFSGGSLFRSTDGGASWQVVDGTDKIPNNVISSFEIKPATSPPSIGTEIMFIGHSSGALYRSVDDGATWIEAQYNGTVTFPPNFWSGFPANSIPNDFDIANFVFGYPTQVENFKMLFVSTGSNSNPFARLLVAREGGLYYSDNYNATLTAIGNQVSNSIQWDTLSAINTLFTSTNVPYAYPLLTDKHKIYVTDVEQFQKGSTTYLVAHVARKELNTVPNSKDSVRTIRDFIVYSADDGTTWAFLGGSGSIPLYQGDTVFDYTLDSNQEHAGVKEANIEVRKNGGNYLYASYYGGKYGYKLYRFDLNSSYTTNAWENKSRTVGYQGSLLALPYSFAINPSDDEEYWHCTNNFVHVDNNVIMNEYYDYGKKRHPDVRDILIIDANTMYIATDGGIYKSTTAGDNFDPVSEGLGGANTGNVGVSQQPPFYVGAGFWHSGLQIYNPAENKWHFGGMGDATGGNFSFLNNQYYALQYYFAHSSIKRLYDSLKHVRGLGASMVASSIAWSENVKGLGYGGWSNIVIRTNNNFHNIDTPVLPTSFTSITKIYTVPNAKDRLVVYDEATKKLYFLDNATTTPTYITDHDLNAVYQNLSGSSGNGWFADMAFDPNNPDKFYLVLSENAAWNPTSTGRIAEYDPVSGVFQDITYKTDDVIYGNPTTDFPKYFSIRDIDIDRQTGILYIGTSNGIYYLDDVNNIWRKYSTNVPFISSDIEILHCKGEIYSSSLNRGIWKAPLIRTNIPKREWNITANTTWNSRMNLFCTLVVDSGATLTVNDSLIVYGEQKIIVKPCGQLIIDGGFLSTECGDMWEGIQVWGDNTKNQYNNPSTGRPDQGMLVIKNGSVIEYARESGVMYNPDVWGTAGGIIQASNSTFRNNGRSAQFISYRNFRPGGNPSISTDIRDNRSYFVDCLFEITGPLPSNQSFNAFVTMWDVRGINFTGCTFQNMRTGIAPMQDYGKGIYCIDASFRVLPRCQIFTVNCPPQNTDKNIFKNLWVGVWPVGTSSNTKNYVVNKSIFENCQVGILSDAVSNMRITDNLFDIGGQPGATSQTKQWGISLQNGTSGFKLEGNGFTQSNTLTSDSTGGIWANHTGTSNNNIYRNTFEDLRWGNQATGINKFNTNSPFTPGLRYECNVNTDVGFDFYVWVPIPAAGFGIKPWQGSMVLAAGNIFSNNSTHFDFANQASGLVRYYYSNNTTNEYPNDVSNVSRFLAANTNTCQPTYSQGYSHTAELDASQYAQVLADFDNYNTAYTVRYNDLAARMDGGNTSYLVRFIKGARVSDSIPLYDTLLKYTPFLSELALKNAVDRSDALSDQRQFAILLGNPGGLRNNIFLEYLGKKKNPLPQWMIDSLYDSRDSITNEIILSDEVTYYDELRVQALNALVSHTLADSVGQNDSVLRELLKAYKNPLTDYQVVSSFIETGDYAKASVFLDGIDERHSLSGYALEEYKNFKTYVDFILNILNIQQKTIAQLNQSEINSLRAIADISDSYLGSVRARNILNFFYGYDYWQEPQFGSLGKPVISTTDPDPDLQESVVKIYPNPTKDYLTFSYNLTDLHNDLELTIIDIQGREVYSKSLKGRSGIHTISVEGWANGIYMYRLTGDGKQLHSGKFIVE